MPPHGETIEPNRRTARFGAASVVTRTEIGSVISGLVLPFVLVLYLALQGGGYDAVVRSEVGIAVWWVVLLGSIAGVLPFARISAAGWAGLGLLIAFAAWTALGISWSDSNERSVAELARVATYLGVFALALSSQGRDGLRQTVASIGAALAVVGLLALLSRLHPSWFPADEAGAAFELTRLNYPVNYWNGLAALMAIGVPLLLVVAVESRRVVTKALATAVIPVMALAGFYTLSRGGALEMAVALGAFLVLFPRRLAALPALLLACGGSALLIIAATQRNALEDGLATQAASTQGDEMLAMTIVVCAGIGLVSAAIGLATRYELGPRVSVSRRAAAGGFATSIAIAVVVALAAGLPGEISDRWEEFKQPVGPEARNTAERFESASGNGRYQWWEAAVDAAGEDPLIGIGPGTFEYFWAEEGSLPGFVRDAHSLFLETLAELGVVGLALIAALVFGVIGYGAWQTLLTRSHSRPWLAGATAAASVFAVAAMIDWAWELAVIPVVFMLLAAALLGAGEEVSEQHGGGRSPAPRIALAVLAAAALIAIAIPLAGTSSVRASQAEVNSQQLGPALDRAQQASEIQPWAASAHLQKALVFELRGDLDEAVASARAATDDEPTNWRTWLVLSRIEAYRGEAEASVRAYREARSLNPRSVLFAR